MKKAREEIEKQLKEEAEREKKEEVAEEKAAAKKKAEEERLSRLSAADQKKVCSLVSLKVYLSNRSLIFLLVASRTREEACYPQKPRQGQDTVKIGNHLLRIIHCLSE